MALRIGSWVSGAYDDRLRVEVLSCFLNTWLWRWLSVMFDRIAG